MLYYIFSEKFDSNIVEPFIKKLEIKKEEKSMVRDILRKMEKEYRENYEKYIQMRWLSEHCTQNVIFEFGGCKRPMRRETSCNCCESSVYLILLLDNW